MGFLDLEHRLIRLSSYIFIGNCIQTITLVCNLYVHMSMYAYFLGCTATYGRELQRIQFDLSLSVPVQRCFFSGVDSNIFSVFMSVSSNSGRFGQPDWTRTDFAIESSHSMLASHAVVRLLSRSCLANVRFVALFTKKLFSLILGIHIFKGSKDSNALLKIVYISFGQKI